MNHKHMIKQVLYNLKREYGTPIDWIRYNHAEFDVETGKQSITHTSYKILKAIVLPDKQSRTVSQSLSFLAANKNFVYGGHFDSCDRLLIVDVKDFKIQMTPCNDDNVLINSKRYAVKDFKEEYEGLAFLVALNHIVGRVPDSSIGISVTDRLTVGETNARTLA